MLALLAGAAGAEASIPRPEASAELAGWPAALPDAPALVDLEIAPAPAIAPPAPAAAPAAGDRFSLFDSAPAAGLFAAGRTSVRARLDAETRLRVHDLELAFRVELAPLEVAERDGFTLLGRREPRRGSENRQYDPELGRFLTTDPLGYVDGPNPYQYGLNNPVNFSDPMGLQVPAPAVPAPAVPPPAAPPPALPPGWYVVPGGAGAGGAAASAGTITAGGLLAAGATGVATAALTRLVNYWTGGRLDEWVTNNMANNLLVLSGRADVVNVDEPGELRPAAPGNLQPNVLIAEGYTPLQDSQGNILGWVPPPMGPGPAHNAANAERLRIQLLAEEIAQGHAFEKHVLEQGEFRGLEIRTRAHFRTHIENVVSNPSSTRYYRDGRIVYLQESTSTVVVWNSTVGESTAFQPEDWTDYVSELPKRSTPFP